MNITIIAVGRAKDGPERTLFEHYRSRLPWTLELVEVEEKKRLSGRELQMREGELLLGKVPQGAFVVALDERGNAFSSEVLAEKIGRWRDDGQRDIAFLIGGADGHANVVRENANLLLSLGKMTWPHMLVRGMLAEQLYRAWSLLNNHPYHRAGQ